MRRPSETDAKLDRTFVARRLEALSASGVPNAAALCHLASVHWRAAGQAIRKGRLGQALHHLAAAWVAGAELDRGWRDELC